MSAKIQGYFIEFDSIQNITYCLKTKFIRIYYKNGTTKFINFYFNEDLWEDFIDYEIIDFIKQYEKYKQGHFTYDIDTLADNINNITIS
jgi:hypothetical protein